MKKRIFDLILSGLALLAFFIPALIVALSIKLTSRGPILHWATRIGLDNKPFQMPKFRSMRIGTPQVATHLIEDADNYLTPIGGFLRTSSLDELPQLLSIFMGDMSIVGPRPALFNQSDLIELRTKYGVHKLKPGLTGWAQVNGRDELTVEEKVELDRVYINTQSLSTDIKIIIKTATRVLGKADISH